MKAKTKKVLLTLCCAFALVAVTIVGTVAYLTSQDTVTNTFTVGNVAITLDEADVNTDGTVIAGAERVKANEYHLLPGHTYTKDPIVHVTTGSEACWLFVKVENGISAIEDSSNTIAAQMADKGWTAIAEGSNVYARETTNKAGDNVVVFENFKVSDTISNDELSTYADKEIVVTAYAVQADGFSTAAAAWSAAGLN